MTECLNGQLNMCSVDNSSMGFNGIQHWRSISLIDFVYVISIALFMSPLQDAFCILPIENANSEGIRMVKDGN